MRTTLSIDDDVLAAVKTMASLQRKSIGEVISTLTRQALRPSKPRGNTRNGVPLLPARAGGRRVGARPVLPAVTVGRWLTCGSLRCPEMLVHLPTVIICECL